VFIEVSLSALTAMVPADSDACAVLRGIAMHSNSREIINPIFNPVFNLYPPYVNRPPGLLLED
jgi:hypothetical protein